MWERGDHHRVADEMTKGGHGPRKLFRDRTWGCVFYYHVISGKGRQSLLVFMYTLTNILYYNTSTDVLMQIWYPLYLVLLPVLPSIYKNKGSDDDD